MSAKMYPPMSTGPHQSTGQPPMLKTKSRFDRLSLWLVAIETVLVTMALIPAKVWAIIPMTTSGNGPFPGIIAPVIILMIYALPVVIGYRNKQWHHALLLGTLPALIGLAIFLVLSAVKLGAFYIVAQDRVGANVSTIELFAALSGAGWLIRVVLGKS